MLKSGWRGWPPGAVRDLHRRVEVHVGRAEMADGERVAAEVDGVEAVVHDQLRAHRVVDAGRKDVWLLRQQAAKTLARVLVARRRDREPTRKKRSLDELHGCLLTTRFRGRSCRARGTRTRARCFPTPTPAIGILDPCSRNYQRIRYTSNQLI